jgi:hypothetical protein
VGLERPESQPRRVGIVTPRAAAGSRLGFGIRSQPSGRDRGRGPGVPDDVGRRRACIIDQPRSHGGALAKAYPRSPAMAAGVADHIWAWDEIAVLLDN